MESNTLANIVAIKQLQRGILKNTKSLCMKESNTLANIAAIKLSKREILKNTKSLCMMDSNQLLEVTRALQQTRFQFGPNM